MSERLPPWANEVAGLYRSGAHSQFILYGNVNDRLVLPLHGGPRLGGIREFLLEVLMPHFDVVISLDIGNGIRIDKGGELFSEWPEAKSKGLETLRDPRRAIEHLTHYFRYCGNLGRMGSRKIQVGCYVRSAHLIAPALGGGFSYDVSALAMLMRDWATDTVFTEHPLATFLVTENINDLNPLLVNNPRAARIGIPLPTSADLTQALTLIEAGCRRALAEYSGRLEQPAAQLVGSSLSAVESLFKARELRGEAVTQADLASLKKRLVENDANGLIEFVDSDRTLDDIQGQAEIKDWLRKDIELWRAGDLEAVPMGYLLCGPVGTGKSFMVECLAGEAQVPVVKLKNFRDRWVGSSEGNLEKIFRLLHALGRCYVFIDEADQALGSRAGGGGDSGVSGRLYSMMAEEMARPQNRGRIIWVLASSRPDLIEVDLKRPGRVDVKIPLFPATTPEESFGLIQALCRKKGLAIPDALGDKLAERMPTLLTPGAAESLAVKIYRVVKTTGLDPAEALEASLADYRSMVPGDVMAFQVRLAIEEASDAAFVPEDLARQYGDANTVGH